jgi:hypothetical protein
MGGDAGEREYRPGLWMIQFTACDGDRAREDGDRAREYARQAASRDGALEVAAAGRYGFAAVGTHQQVTAVRDVVMSAGESFVITRAIMGEPYPDGQLLFYEGGDPGAFRAQAMARLGFEPADYDRWESEREFWCPARVLDIVLADYGEWQLRQENGRDKEG